MFNFTFTMRKIKKFWIGVNNPVLKLITHLFFFSPRKNFSLISNQESGRVLHVDKASAESGDIYTCVLIWEHGGRKLNSSVSHQLVIESKVLSLICTVVSWTSALHHISWCSPVIYRTVCHYSSNDCSSHQ